jgi:hypothetical protein
MTLYAMCSLVFLFVVAIVGVGWVVKFDYVQIVRGCGCGCVAVAVAGWLLWLCDSCVAVAVWLRGCGCGSGT